MFEWSNGEQKLCEQNIFQMMQEVIYLKTDA